jgi:hypothetical protein
VFNITDDTKPKIEEKSKVMYNARETTVLKE